MTLRYRIVEAEPAHLRAIRNRLRTDDLLEITALCQTSPQALWRSYSASTFRRAAIVDGEVAAVWGCAGSSLGLIGVPWLLTAPEVERIPVAMVREARAEVGKMLGLYGFLENIVAARYVRACKFLEVVGFRLDDPMPVASGVMFRRFWMER